MPEENKTNRTTAQQQEGLWLIIPPTVLGDDALTPGAKMVYGRVFGLMKKHGYCYASNEYIGLHIGLKKNTVKAHLVTLYKKGYLRYELIRAESGEIRERRIYPVLSPEQTPEPEQENTRGGRTSPHPTLERAAIRGRTSPHPKRIEREKKNLSNSNIRKATAFKTETGGEGSADARSHIARETIRNRKEEAETKEQTGRGVTFSPDKGGTTDKQEVRGRTQQVTPTSSIPKSVQENTERGTNGHSSTAHQTLTQKRAARTQSSKHRQPVYVGKPLTQEEIDEKRRNGQNASGYTPLSQIPSSHWQELETRAGAHPTNGNGNGHHSGAQNGNGLHYSAATTHAPDFIDALIEQFSKLLHDEAANIPQNINRAAKLYRQSEAGEELFIASMHDAYTTARRKQKITTLHSDGRPNKMPYFFSVLADKLGVKPNQPT